MNIKQDDIIELTIEKLVYSGSGFSHYNGQVVFVENAVPGDIVKAKVLRVNKNFIQAKVDEILTSSQYRVKPFCPLFNACGGCNLQNVDYDYLIEQKQIILKEFFSSKILKDFDDIEFKPFIKSDVTKEYRCKVQNAISETKVSKRLLCGYYKENTHDVVNIKYCPIQPRIIEQIINYIRENWKLGGYIEKKDKGLLKHVIIRYSSTSKKIILTFVINKDLEWFNKVENDIKSFSDEIIKSFPDVSGVLVNFNPKKTNKILGEKTELIAGEDFIFQKLYSNDGIEYNYKVSKNSFFQTNPFVAQKVFDAVKSLLKANSTILDAYGGVGTIGIFLNTLAKRITLVEECESAIIDAKTNFKLNGCKNYEVFLGNAKRIFKDFLKKKKKFDYAVIDPPRKGSDKESLDSLSKLANAIVYVSCNPATLMRDAKILNDFGFKLKTLQGADMFPYTHHIESIAYFEK